MSDEVRSQSAAAKRRSHFAGAVGLRMCDRAFLKISLGWWERSRFTGALGLRRCDRSRTNPRSYQSKLLLHLDADTSLSFVGAL
jgi:hypothetical protein